MELDVGSEGNGDEAQIRAVLQDVVAAGSIASFVTSPVGFQFRRLGAGEHQGGTEQPPHPKPQLWGHWGQHGVLRASTP